MQGGEGGVAVFFAVCRGTVSARGGGGALLHLIQAVMKALSGQDSAIWKSRKDLNLELGREEEED